MRNNYLEYAAMFLGAALDHELPECNGKGRVSTIKVDQYKTKFSDVRIYCTLAHEDRVLDLWTRGGYETRLKGDGTPYVYEDFRKNQFLYDAIHYRKCYIAALSMFVPVDEMRGIRSGADYHELLCSNEEELNTWIQKDIDHAAKYSAYHTPYLKRYSVDNYDDLRVAIKKIMTMCK